MEKKTADSLFRVLLKQLWTMGRLQSHCVHRLHKTHNLCLVWIAFKCILMVAGQISVLLRGQVAPGPALHIQWGCNTVNFSWTGDWGLARWQGDEHSFSMS